jgi:hypothetical protein
MKTAKLWLGAAVIAIAALRSTLPTPALADTFQIFNLGPSNDRNIFGIDTSGAVVISMPLFGLYKTYVDGVLTNSSTTIPNLIYDNGTACIPTVSPPVTWSPGIGNTRCNNGHEVYTGLYPDPSNPNSFSFGIFTGPDITDRLTDPAMPLVASSPLDAVVMNASGDFIWVDGRFDIFFEAIDLTTAPTPEPGSILLVGTGALAAAAAMRRRFLQ